MRFLDFTETTGIILLSIFGALMILVVFIIVLQPVSTVDLTFKVPLVPFIPCLSVLVNLYLMFQLDGPTWIRFLIWVAIGYAIYFIYGIRKSEEGSIQKQNLIASINVKEIEANNGNSGIVNNGFVESDKM
uniref:Cationic amino acid transporter C-terminal domain-containing protein n=1 Tax=Megaselia scalaris TaxID=36166 RepID=T1GT74_MEGSC